MVMRQRSVSAAYNIRSCALGRGYTVDAVAVTLLRVCTGVDAARRYVVRSGKIDSSGHPPPPVFADTKGTRFPASAPLVRWARALMPIHVYRGVLGNFEFEIFLFIRIVFCFVRSGTIS